MTTTPTPRPIPTREDRMRDARTDAFTRVGQHAKAITDQIAGSFGTYLDAQERDQLDARAACAEQERDEALDELQELKQHHTLLHTKVNALENDLRSANRAIQEFAAQAERDRRAIADMAKLRAELGAAQELIAVVDDVTEQLDRARARYDARPAHADDDERTQPHEDPSRLRQQLADAHADCARYATERDEALDTISAARKALQEGNGNALWDALNVTKAPPLSPPTAALGSAAPRAQEPTVIDAGHLARQRAFSGRTFGPGPRTEGVLDHIRKELAEIEASPYDLGEWVDVVILALDGAWRAGHEPQQIIDAIVAKQARNEARTWPDWRTADPGKAIEHDRSAETPRAEDDPADQLAAEARDYQWAPDADTERVLGVFTAPLRQAGYGED